MDMVTGLKLFFPLWWCEVINDLKLSFALKRLLNTLVILIFAIFYILAFVWLLFQIRVLP